MKYLYYPKKCYFCKITYYYSYINKNLIFCKTCKSYIRLNYVDTIGNWDWA